MIAYNLKNLLKSLILICFLSIAFRNFSLAQTPVRSVVMTVENPQHFKLFNELYRDTVINAFRIMTAIYSSKEFQDSVSKIFFKCEAYGDGCGVLAETNGRIAGTTVLDMLFKNPANTVHLKVHESGNALGVTDWKTNKTEVYYENIKGDMPELPFTYSLAVNLCHEYMHTLGFIHLYCPPHCDNELHEVAGNPDPKFINDDVTYRVGWIAYYILLRKLNNHEDPYQAN